MSYNRSSRSSTGSSRSATQPASGWACRSPKGSSNCMGAGYGPRIGTAAGQSCRLLSPRTRPERRMGSMEEQTVRVLVVDDDRAIRRLLQTSLGAHGYEVIEASTGHEALEAVIAHRPDLIILDLGLPDLDGVDVTRQLREWSQI